MLRSRSEVREKTRSETVAADNPLTAALNSKAYHDDICFTLDNPLARIAAVTQVIAELWRANSGPRT
jgi:hypothetical protein